MYDFNALADNTKNEKKEITFSKTALAHIASAFNHNVGGCIPSDEYDQKVIEAFIHSVFKHPDITSDKKEISVVVNAVDVYIILSALDIVTKAAFSIINDERSNEAEKETAIMFHSMGVALNNHLRINVI